MTATSLDLAAVKTDSTNYQEAFRILIGVYSKDEVDALIGSAGSSTWGSIGGTLSNQTDLQNALNAKANSSHTHSTEEVTGLDAALSGKQATLASGTNIKTINGVSALGAGDLVVGTIGGSTGPTDNRILRSDGTAGATAQNSALTIDDSGNMSGVVSITVDSFGAGDAALILETITDPSNTAVKAARIRTPSQSRRLYIGDNSQKFYALNLSGVTSIESMPGFVTTADTMSYGILAASIGLYRASDTVQFVNGNGGYDWKTGTGYAAPGSQTTRMTLSNSGALTSVSVSASTSMQTGVYTFATVPSASANAGRFIRISDRGQKHAYSDGTNWRFFGDDAIIS